MMLNFPAPISILREFGIVSALSIKAFLMIPWLEWCLNPLKIAAIELEIKLEETEVPLQSMQFPF